MTNSRISKFYAKSLAERCAEVARVLDLPETDLRSVLQAGGLDADTADKMIENVLGTYALPFGLALNFSVNGVDRLLPMVVEEPSVVAAASGAALRVRNSGGFVAETLGNAMTAQIETHGVADPSGAQTRIHAAADDLLAMAAEAVPGLVRRGGGPLALEVRVLGDGYLVVHVQVDCKDAMGANLVNSVAERLGPEVARLAGGTMGLRILTNLCDQRRVRVTCEVRSIDLEDRECPMGGMQIAEGIEAASRFAELDPYRAATHNKGIMNGIDSVVLATGNDCRAVEAGAHAYAARNGSYGALATWRRTETGLTGALELPLSLGIVGGTLRVHPAAQLALKILGVDTASQLAEIAASAGLASNLAALRALATDGIQRGHMALQARSVATEAGATGSEVEAVVALIVKAKTIHVAAARAALAKFRCPERS